MINPKNKLIIYTPFLIFVLILSNFGSLLAQDSLLIETINTNTYDLKIENNRLSGSGAPLIQQAIEESQFLLVGEQHGIREVSEFTSALFSEATPYGYEHLCIETDPHAASKLEELAKKGDEAMVDFLSEYPNSVPFYDAKEEFSFLQNAVKHSTQKDAVIWGVDQVYLTMPRYLFKLLAKETQNEATKLVTSEYFDRAMKQYKLHEETNKASLNATDFEKLYDAFGPGISTKAKRILEDIQTTQQIYMHYMKGEYYLNNRVRAQLMKKQFMEYYKQTESNGDLPKVLLKFGATHTYKGLSLYYQFDLGNMVYELAEMNGTRAVSFQLNPIKGQAKGFAEDAKSFDNSESLNPIIKKVLENRIEDESWILIDMRPLRSILKQDDLEKIKDLVFGYDFWIYVPEAHPLTNF